MSERMNGAKLIAAIRKLAAQGLTVHQIGQQLGHHHANIAKYAATHDVAVRSIEEIRRDKADSMRDLANEGFTVAEIAIKLKMTENAVRKFAARYGADLSSAPRAKTGAKRCPAGIPKDLQDEYRDFERELGPTLAERAVRRLMEGGL